MYEIIIITSLAIIFAILLSKWPKTKPLTMSPPPSTEDVSPELSDTDFLKRGEELFKQKDYKGAEKYYVRAVSKEPNNPLIYSRLGVIYTQLGNLKDANEALKMAAKLDPDNGFYQNNLGLVLYNLGRFKEAVLYFENAVNIDDGVAKRWLNLGMCLEKVGNLQKAKESYKRVIKLEPKNEKYKELLANIDKKTKI